MNIICYLKKLSNENCYNLIELIDFENTIVNESTLLGDRVYFCL